MKGEKEREREWKMEKKSERERGSEKKSRRERVKRLLIQNEDVILYIHVYICYFTGFGIYQYPSSLDKCYGEKVRCAGKMRERERERGGGGGKRH